MIKICDYGCGQEAFHQMSSGKWCCCKFYSQCPSIREKNSTGNIGKKRNIDIINRYEKRYPGINIIEEMRYNPDKPDKNEIQVRCRNKECQNSKMFDGWFIPTQMQINERMRCYKAKHGQCFFFCSSSCKDLFFEKFYNKIINKKKIRLGDKNGMFGIPSPNKYTINNIKNKYPFFSKIEEMRYNPVKIDEKEIQVHCKNHNCPNSKEKDGWFPPTYSQLYERIRALEKNYGNDGNYLYCSQSCKDDCVLYNVHSDPYKEKNELLYTSSEYNIWNQVVLEQDNHECQKCGSKKELHCHHIQPVKTHPHLALDPTNGIVLCKKCHYRIGHKTGTECSTGRLASITQQGCKLGEVIND